MTVFDSHSPMQWLAFVGVVVAAITVSSCSEESTTHCPRFDVGVVEGRVVAAGHGVSVEVIARAEEGPFRGAWVADTQADSNGIYRFELPNGLYRIGLLSQDDWVVDPAEPDTIRVSSRVCRVDFRMGSARVRLGLPQGMDGDRIWLNLAGAIGLNRHSSTYVDSGEALFEFPVIAAGDYVMRIGSNNFDGSFYLPADDEGGARDTLSIGFDDPASYLLDLAPRFASVSGHITGSCLEAGSYYPEVFWVGLDHGRLGRAECDEAGAFTINILQAETGRLQVSHGGITRWYGGDSFETADVFELEPGDHIEGLDMIGSGIEIWLEGPGHLTDHRADVLVRGEGGEVLDTVVERSMPTVICTLAPGRYYVGVDGRCLRQIWAPAWFDGGTTPESATPIDLEPGELRRIVIPVEEGGSITGDVLTAAGGRPNSVRVAIYDDVGELLCGSSDYLDRGEIRYVGLSDGEYFVAVWLDGGVRWWYPGTQEFASATALRIDGHTAISGLRWFLPAETKQVSR